MIMAFYSTPQSVIQRRQAELHREGSSGWMQDRKKAAYLASRDAGPHNKRRPCAKRHDSGPSITLLAMACALWALPAFTVSGTAMAQDNISRIHDEISAKYQHRYPKLPAYCNDSDALSWNDPRRLECANIIDEQMEISTRATREFYERTRPELDKAEAQLQQAAKGLEQLRSKTTASFAMTDTPSITRPSAPQGNTVDGNQFEAQMNHFIQQPNWATTLLPQGCHWTQNFDELPDVRIPESHVLAPSHQKGWNTLVCRAAGTVNGMSYSASWKYFAFITDADFHKVKSYLELGARVNGWQRNDLMKDDDLVSQRKKTDDTHTPGHLLYSAFYTRQTASHKSTPVSGAVIMDIDISDHAVRETDIQNKAALEYIRAYHIDPTSLKIVVINITGSGGAFFIPPGGGRNLPAAVPPSLGQLERSDTLHMPLQLPRKPSWPVSGEAIRWNPRVYNWFQ